MQDSGTITVDPQLQAKIDGLIAELTPAARAVLADEVGQLYAAARRRWPVASGASKAGLKLSVRVVGDRVVAGISNDVPRAQYVRSSRQARRGGAAAWDVQVTRPGRREAPRVAERVADAIAEDSNA